MGVTALPVTRLPRSLIRNAQSSGTGSGILQHHLIGAVNEDHHQNGDQRLGNDVEHHLKLMIGGKLFGILGILGILCCIPLTAVGLELVKEDACRRLRSKEMLQ